MSITKFSWFKTIFHYQHFKMNVACIRIPKNHVHKCIDFSLYTNFPNLISYLLRMRSPLKESTSCFLKRSSLLVLVPISLFHKTQSPRFYHSQDSKSSLLSFIGLKVLILYLSGDSKSSQLSFQRLSQSFVLRRQSRSFAPSFQRLSQSFVLRRQSGSSAFSFQRLSQSFVQQRQSRSSTFTFQRLS